jgi:hypothetical protein
MGSKGGIAVVVFIIAVIVAPLIYGATENGIFQKPPKPQLVLPVGGDGKCIEETAFMRANHMKLLVHARDRIVRHGENLPKLHIESCKNCHLNRATFCDRCHDYAGVKPDCWECHFLP